MIEINLLPQELRKKESVKIALPDIPIKKTLIIAFGSFFGLQLLFTMVTFYHFFLDKKSPRLTADVSSYEFFSHFSARGGSAFG